MKTKILDLWNKSFLSLQEYYMSLRDVRNAGPLVFVGLALLVSWSSARAIQSNYTLQKEVGRLGQENAVAELQNENQRLQNLYYTTSQYRELTARQNFGLAAPGETVLLVNEDVALANTVPMPVETESATIAKKKPFWQQNFESWIDYLLHRNISS